MSRAPVQEKSFPRGGKKPKKWTSGEPKFSLFNIKKNKIAKKKLKQKKKNELTNAISLSVDVNKVSNLTAANIQPGMVIYGCIDKVTDVNIQFSLPASFRAIVSIINISDYYKSLNETQLMQIEPLSNTFKIGDHYPIVMSTLREGNQTTYNAILNPKNVNSKLSARLLQNGMILTGTVTSCEEHGYVVDVGIPKVTAFLKKTNADVAYSCNQLVKLAVHRTSSDGHMIQLAACSMVDKFEDITKELSIHSFIPGFRFKLMVTKVIKNGVEVALMNFGESVKGYIHVNYMEKLFSKASDFEVGTTLEGVLLYVIPLLNNPYFMALKQEQPQWDIPFGSIVENMKVVKVEKNCLVGKITSKQGKNKCFVPLNKVGKRVKVAAEEARLKDMYPVGTIIPKVRIMWPSMLSRFYFGAFDKESLSQAIFTKTDVKIGQVLQCKILIIGSKYFTVQISPTVKGYVPFVHLTDTLTANYTAKFKVGQKVTARVLSLGGPEELVRLTMKNSLIKAKQVVASLSGFKVNVEYLGTVTSIRDGFVNVEFFGGVMGEIMLHSATIVGLYQLGQLIKCYVKGVRQGKLRLRAKASIEEMKVTGMIHEATVKAVLQEGLQLHVVMDEAACTGFLPKELISSDKGVSAQMLTALKPDDVVKVACVSANIGTPLLTMHPSILAYYQKHDGDWKLPQCGEVVPCVYIPSGKRLELICIVPGADSPVFQEQRRKGLLSKDREPFQFVWAKVLKRTKMAVICSTRVAKVWDQKYMSSIEELANFLEEIHSLQDRINNCEKHPLGGLQIGQTVNGVAKPADNGSIVKVKSHNNVEFRCHKKYSTSSTVVGRIVWIDYLQNVVWLQTSLNKDVGEVKNESRAIVRSRVLHRCPDIVVAKASESNQLIFIPTRRHVNDHESCENFYKVGDLVKLAVFRINSRLFGIDRKVVIRAEIDEAKKSKAKRPKLDDCPQKMNGNDLDCYDEDTIDDVITVEYEKRNGQVNSDSVKMEVLSEDEEEAQEMPNPGEKLCDNSDTEIKSECDSTEDNSMAAFNESSSDDDVNDSAFSCEPTNALDVGFDWSVTYNPKLLTGVLGRHNDQQSSSDEEEEEGGNEQKKRKRLTGAEKREKARLEEEKLRSRELQLVDPTRPPQSADDFDRLVVSTPDDSSIWLQYMSFHLQNTEIEKARAVARRAIKVISFREEQEKLNVWLALLNLEQLYGTAESQKAVLDEALRCNDPYKVHLHRLNALAEQGASIEAEQLANLMMRKYGEKDEVWWQVGAAVMKMGKLDFARSILQRAMAALPNTKHVNLITQFARLENKHGDSERAQTLYENVLTAFPKRVDVWSAYVDLMVKSNRIDLARNILERAISQTLPLKKMKTMFKKFINFEENHGTPESTEKVRQSAAEYIDSLGKDET